jgi:hypothetical protein
VPVAVAVPVVEPPVALVLLSVAGVLQAARLNASMAPKSAV